MCNQPVWIQQPKSVTCNSSKGWKDIQGKQQEIEDPLHTYVSALNILLKPKLPNIKNWQMKTATNIDALFRRFKRRGGRWIYKKEFREKQKGVKPVRFNIKMKFFKSNQLTNLSSLTNPFAFLPSQLLSNTQITNRCLCSCWGLR